MGFSILCDARVGDSLGITRLALVDRSITTKFWWTSDCPGLILNYQKESAAKFVARRLKRNNPRVVDYEFAKRVISEQRERIEQLEESVAFDIEADWHEGWDGHKDY